ncbi:MULTISPECIES: tRNA pseudouridine(55) synthase TruB [Aerococcus]|uniref:tRNA pseudouridine synthase B n=1 Tax=Aerococcus sanguinicola TaxID=119206 RepID=A0A5N1GMF3_9LACT|nr:MULTISPECIES: tRNA pseudouridine(55) synthase TruB [Aerococcus]KAA9301972.1 tRNA pseudouridine(55) synthase TruB [Aerococcus sanguinicola]MDK6368603.1 tRNA pseudouridine(55) synthase TruB [Aerococcus sp. UMB9870]MDK6679686.1 tRNA pseudouridine(55) synthase TruB [Aerococcus sp. UMB8608]MDK6686042.1 tRNA pseudouridine(55) synthase TruB [Aerococcus sp. UMB8623]MDK6940848.1 tRNA pseudouridine(55) synthase TruB [Aerococcus sp. UMB8487]
MDGIIALWKEKGMTSHDCVFKLRKILQTKKVGHTGTLDPNVDGVLPICVGKGTKLVDFMMDKDKVYRGEICLGFATDTQDLDGQVIAESFLDRPLSQAELAAGLKSLEGWIKQVPPMYSAVKVKGKRLYDYARAGETVERPERQVRVDYFAQTGPMAYNKEKGRLTFPFEVKCGKGTYIRTLATDLGAYFGQEATMTQLTRIASTPFQASDCYRLDEIADLMAAGKKTFLHPLDELLVQYPTWQVPAQLTKLVANGAVLNQENLPADLAGRLPVRAYIDGQLKAVYGQHPDLSEQMKPLKMF